MCPGTPNKLMKFCAEWVSCLCLLRKLILILSTFVTWAAGERSYTATTLQLRWVYTIYTAKTMTTWNSIQFLEHNGMFILTLFHTQVRVFIVPHVRILKKRPSPLLIIHLRRCALLLLHLTCSWNSSTSVRERPSTVTWWENLMMFWFGFAKRYFPVNEQSRTHPCTLCSNHNNTGV